MKITDVKATLLNIPWDRQLDSRAHPKPIVEVVVVEILTDDGVVGTGYTYTDGYGGAAIRALVVPTIRELVVGQDPTAIAPLVTDLYWKLRKIGYGGAVSLAIAGFDIAAWDIISKVRKLPLIDLIGSYRDSMPVYSSAVGSRMFGVDEQIEMAAALVSNDFAGVKIQLGRPSRTEDVERVRRVRAGLGDDTIIIVDSNTLWNAEQAIWVGQRILEYAPYYMEEPIPPYDLKGHEKISRTLPLPIATGEAIFDYRGCAEYIERRAVSYIQPNVCRIGGITQWRKVAQLAEAANMKVAPHFVAELHVQLACTVPNALIIEYVPWLIQYLKEPPEIKQGKIFPRRQPGLGMEFQRDALQRFSAS